MFSTAVPDAKQLEKIQTAFPSDFGSHRQTFIYLGGQTLSCFIPRKATVRETAMHRVNFGVMSFLSASSPSWVYFCTIHVFIGTDMLCSEFQEGRPISESQ